MKISALISRQPQWLILLEALSLVAAIGFLDYVTGYDVRLFLFYALPIVFTVAFSGRLAGTIVCIASTAAWYIAAVKSGFPSASVGKLVWNTSVQFGFFISAMLAGFALKSQFAQSRARILQLERFEILAEISPVGMFWTGKSGECIYANRRWCHIAGVSDPAALRQLWTEAIHPDDRERVAMEWQKAIEENRSLRFEGRFKHPDGRVIWALGYVAPEKDTVGGGIRGYVGAVIDMTEHRRMEREILQISEREQQRIGQDLHDDLCQFLVAIQYTAALLARRLERETSGEAGDAREVAELLRSAVGKTRGLARGIFPVRLEQDGLVAALHELAESASKAFKVVCTFECDPPVLLDDASVATHLYRIAQEALNNALKHSRAAHVKIVLFSGDDLIHLRIEDDGVGLPENLPEDHLGMGMHIMEHRANSIGGTLEIARRGAGGTVVSCSLRDPGGTQKSSDNAEPTFSHAETVT